MTEFFKMMNSYSVLYKNVSLNFRYSRMQKKSIFTLPIILLISIIFISCIKRKTPIKSRTSSVIFTDSIYSRYLSEYRKHNVYLPKNFNPKNKYPIIYATDGSDIDDEDFYFKESLKKFDSLIENNIIKPFIFIASYYNKEYTNILVDTSENGKRYFYPFRNIEFEKFNSTQTKDTIFTNRYNNHMQYFKDELITKVEGDFKQSLERNDRYFYGSSAGAGFGISLLNKFPNKIGTYLCFSAYGGNIQSKKWKNNIEYPTLYFQYGTEELLLKDDANYLKSKYQELNSNYYTKQFNGGHNYKTWDKEFIKIITQLFKSN